ncbi:MAG: phosphate starvation-inducible protein PhoH, partial [Candidatus Dadabacteria bacterium]
MTVQNGNARELEFGDNNLVKELYGENNDNLKEIGDHYGIKIHSRGGKLNLEGEVGGVDSADRFLREMYGILEKGYTLDPADIELAARIVDEGKIRLADVFLDTVCVSTRKRIIAPKSIAQKIYIESIRRHDIVFGIGPAGTGKTYLAMAMAVSAFVNKEVNRIVLTRPAVEAGEKLGFLPGDLS